MDKPHAIRLADALDQLYKTPPSVTESAAELRRLHQSEQEGWRWAKECEAEVKRLNKERLDAIDRAYFAGKQAGIAEAVKREWQGLTDEDIKKMPHISPWLVKIIETKLKEKNDERVRG
jgi:hypothetical protein